MGTAVELFATNNAMALPVNPRVVRTLKAAPNASLVAAQEVNLRRFKHALHQLGPHRVPARGFTDKGQAFSCVMLYNPAVWTEVDSWYPLAFEGHHKISLTRHLGVSVFHHKAGGFDLGTISYHAVTKGGDRLRREMRHAGDAAVDEQVAKLRGQGLAVMLGCDQNATGNRLGPADLHSAHRLDHVYGWDSPHTDLTLTKRGRHIDTRSDHDTLVVKFGVATR